MGQQFLKIWKNVTGFQKFALLSIFLFLGSLLFAVVVKNAEEKLVPLSPHEKWSSHEKNEARLLFEKENIPYAEKADGFHVKETELSSLRQKLLEQGLPSEKKSKGFELFDSNTWIKGEKELQMLEMRALKGQLEMDISEFENIKSAKVILDLAPPRPFGGHQYKTKASVILNLMPGKALSLSTLKSITHHISGAVRGLEPHMIAVSDTKGKHYQGISNEENEVVTNFKEDERQEIAEAILSKMFGNNEFYICSSPGQFKIFFNKENTPNTGEIKHVLDAVFEDEREIILEPVSFFKEKPQPIEMKKEKKTLPFIFGAFFLLLVGSFFFFNRKPRLKKPEVATPATPESQEDKMMTQINLDRLSDSIKSEDPETIALMLSYLDPKRADRIITMLPLDVQEAVWNHLSIMENEDA